MSCVRVWGCDVLVVIPRLPPRASVVEGVSPVMDRREEMSLTDSLGPEIALEARLK